MNAGAVPKALQFSLVGGGVLILEHIEDNLQGWMPVKFFQYSADGYLRGLFIGKMEFAGGYAAKGDGVQIVFSGQLQAGAVAGGELCGFCGRGLAVLGRDDGPDGVEHIAAGQVEGGGEFGLPRRFIMSLGKHELRAGIAQLQTRG